MQSKSTHQLKAGNLFHDIPRNLPEELLTRIASSPTMRIERIVSTGHITPDGEWYDQDADEWVMVLKERARLGFDDGRSDLEMAPGDHVMIPAHCRHRVLWTSEDEPTIWLAVHYVAVDEAR
jgi:cupin 2 domain-containing protein